jgi:hypothetical protein|tara:strand:+ start:696 stop:1085 length:390 start_codon:yes stop_codon:yes gene_type:complete
MHKLKFYNDKNNTLSDMIAWASDRPRKIPYVKEYTDDMGLWLVKDHGIYLMSPTDEKFTDAKGVINKVVYAKGYKPTKANRDTLWDKTHDVSRDDFAEFCPLEPQQVKRVKDGAPIEIRLSDTEMHVLV